MAARQKGRSRLERPVVDLQGDETIIDLREGQQPGVLDEAAATSRSDSERPAQLRESKFFGSPAFRRLWFSQVFSSLGDWIGFIAIAAMAARFGGSAASGGASVSIVLSARLIPGFFLSPFAGVLIDRYSRKAIMVWCDAGRALVLLALPFARNLPELFLASLFLELMTSLWSPAKESSVPHLVSRSFLPNANSLSLAAAYGTFPFASAAFALLAKIPDWIGQERFFNDHLINEACAIWFDAFTYVLSAAVIATLTIHHERKAKGRSEDESRTSAGFREAKEGWSYIAGNPRVRAVMLGLGTGLIGGGMVVPLGPAFATRVLSAGSSGYGLLLTAMGTGVGAGIVGLTVLQKRVSVDRAFVLAILGAGTSIIAAATMHNLAIAVACIGILGLFAGAVYVLGFTIVQLNTKDEMRGRVFATLYTMTRACILISFVLASVLSAALDKLARVAFGTPARIPGLHLTLYGERLTLWFAGLIIVLAGLLAVRSLRKPAKVEAAS